MTVCVATIASNGLIIGAADRMLTAGVKQTEPESTKIYHDPNRPHSLMWAGSASLQGELMDDYHAALKSDLSKYRSVKESVNLYCSCYGAIRARRAEAAILQPFRLDTATLISRQAKMDSSIVSELMQALVSYNLPPDDSVQAIIAGIDPDGLSHIWSVTDGKPSCHDMEGFAAIGIGFDHSDSQLRFSGYTRNRSAQEATIMTYFAKRRAEVAPGVGRVTDMFTRSQSAWVRIPDDWLLTFEGIYKRLIEEEAAALKGAVIQTAKYFEELFTPPTPTVTVEPTSLPAQQSPPASTHDQ